MLNNKPLRKRKVKNSYKLKQVIILFGLVICFASFVTTFGRYAIKNINDFFMKSKDFYFYSDKLKESTATYQVNNWSGTGNYVITINMNSRGNNLIKTPYDIGYDITYSSSSNVICQLSKTNGTIPTDTNSDFFTLTIIPNIGLKTGDVVWVHIKATSNTQYHKEISANFTLVVGQEDIFYEISDRVGSQYLELNITNTLSYYKVQQSFDMYQIGDRIDMEDYLLLSDTNKAKCHSAKITITFDPNKILLDITNSNYLKATNVTTQIIDGNSYINGITFLVDAIASTTVRLYKKDIMKNYTYPIINPVSIVNVTSI